MKALLFAAAVLPLLVAFTASGSERKPAMADYSKLISFHSPSMPGYRTGDMLSYGFVGATVTLSSNSKYLNLNDLSFQSSRDWLEVEQDYDIGRVTLRMIRQPKQEERAATLILHNHKTRQTQTFPIYVKKWLVGKGSVDPNASAAWAHCKRLNSRLLTTQEFRTLSRQWFGLSSGKLREMYPDATIFNEHVGAGGSFWVHEAKALYLHTGVKSNMRNVHTLCMQDYSR